MRSRIEYERSRLAIVRVNAFHDICPGFSSRFRRLLEASWKQRDKPCTVYISLDTNRSKEIHRPIRRVYSAEYFPATAR